MSKKLDLGLSEKTKGRLLELADAIETGEHFDIESWFQVLTPSCVGDDPDKGVRDKVNKLLDLHNDLCYDAEAGSVSELMGTVKKYGEEGMPFCRTEMCIAGWACYLWRGEVRKIERMASGAPYYGSQEGKDFGSLAQRILGLNFRQSENIFHSESWSADAQMVYGKAQSLDIAERERKRKPCSRRRARLVAKFLRQTAKGTGDPFELQQLLDEGSGD